MDVADAGTPAELDEVRRLVRAFLAWHRDRHADDLDRIDAFLDDRAFEELLARLEGAAVGCVAVRRLDDGYATRYLDTSVRQTDARSFPASLGFEEVGPNYDVPAQVRDWLVFCRLDL